MTVELDDARRAQMIERLRGYFLEEFDEELSAFRAEGVLDFFLKRLGPSIYNQGVEDARIYMTRKLEDLDVEVHEPDVG